MFVLITLIINVESYFKDENKLTVLLDNFFNVGFIKTYQSLNKLIFKGFIDDFYDLYFSSLLGFIYEDGKYDNYIRRGEIVFKSNGKIINKSSLQSFYLELKENKKPSSSCWKLSYLFRHRAM